MPYGTVNVDAMTTSDGVTSSGLYGFKNRIINGAMMIDQRNAGAAVSPSAGGAYVVDRWLAFASQSGKYTAQQGTTNLPAGFINSLNCVSSSAYSVATSDYFMFTHRVEGLNVSDLNWGTANAQPVTLSFWVRSSLTGTFGGSLVNSAQNRSYPFSYSISSANTPTFITITIAGDTSGTWLTTNGIGIGINFGLGVGSTLSGAAGAWAGAGYYSATGATSVVGTNGATFYITGVQLEKGSTATSFDYRPYGTELALCQRYFQLQSAGVSGICSNTTDFIAAISFTCVMRSQPTASCPALRISDVYTNAWVQSSPSAALRTASVGAVSGGTYVFSNFSGLTAGRVALVESAGYQPISLSSEL